MGEVRDRILEMVLIGRVGESHHFLVFKKSIISIKEAKL